MTYEINNQGISVPRFNEIVDDLTNKMQQVYGSQTNLDQNTPDGQWINILAQNQTDTNEVAKYIYNSFDPDVAEGRALDRDVSYNGIVRQAGSYTQLAITLTINQTTTLQGLDDNYNDPQGTGFTVADSTGNNYILITTQTVQAGEVDLLFRCENIGAQTPELNTITNIITPQVGVLTCLNKSAPIQIGTNEESDYQLKQRFNETFARGGLGNWESVKSELLALDGVLSVSGENNRSDNVSPAGTKGHSAWFIILGGDNDEIGKTIHRTLNAGCGLRGDIVVPITTVFNTVDKIYFDRPSTEQLYIMFDVLKKDTSTIVDLESLKEQLVSKLVFKINEQLDSSQINIILTSIDNSLVYSNIELSTDGINYYDIVKNTNLNNIFILPVDNINITER